MTADTPTGELTDQARPPLPHRAAEPPLGWCVPITTDPITLDKLLRSAMIWSSTDLRAHAMSPTEHRLAPQPVLFSTADVEYPWRTHSPSIKRLRCGARNKIVDWLQLPGFHCGDRRAAAREQTECGRPRLRWGGWSRVGGWPQQTLVLQANLQEKALELVSFLLELLLVGLGRVRVLQPEGSHG